MIARTFFLLLLKEFFKGRTNTHFSENDKWLKKFIKFNRPVGKVRYILELSGTI